MKTKEISPIEDHKEGQDQIEKLMKRIWKQKIYLPLLKQLRRKQTSVANSNDPVYDAFASGRIRFDRGKVTGKFNASISRRLRELGAQYDRALKGYRLPKAALTTDMKSAIALSEANFLKTMQAMDRELGKMLPEEIAGSMRFEKIFDTTLFRVNKDLEDKMKGLIVGPKLTKEGRARFAEEYTTNLQRYVKDFTEKEVLKLRKTVQKHVSDGGRYEDLVKSIEKSYGVTTNKAKFLARQETNLMTSAFKKTRLTDYGVNEYRWSTVAGSASHPVRPMHKRLDGKTFSWDAPPITDDKGNRNHPGEDYNCRCKAIPIVRF